MKYAATPFGLLALIAAAPENAQAQRPAESVVPPAGITRIVRSSGLNPLGPPVRQRSIYVLRATNARGLQVSVIVDAHDGRMLAVGPVIPGPRGGRVGTYGPPPSGYAAVTPQRQPGTPSREADDEAAYALSPGARAPAMAPPLPRPRPANLAAEKDDAAAASPASPDSPAKRDDAAKPDSPQPSDARKPHGGPLPIDN